MTKNEKGETILPANEAALVTIDNMTDLSLLLPEDIDPNANVPPAVRFLTACMVRAEQEEGWAQEMVAWMDAQMEEEDLREADVAGSA